MYLILFKNPVSSLGKFQVGICPGGFLTQVNQGYELENVDKKEISITLSGVSITKERVEMLVHIWCKLNVR